MLFVSKRIGSGQVIMASSPSPFRDLTNIDRTAKEVAAFSTPKVRPRAKALARSSATTAAPDSAYSPATPRLLDEVFRVYEDVPMTSPPRMPAHSLPWSFNRPFPFEKPRDPSQDVVVLEFQRYGQELNDAVCAFRLTGTIADRKPSWANGAKLLVPDARPSWANGQSWAFSMGDAWEARASCGTRADLGPSHVIIRSRDVEALMEHLRQTLPWRSRRGVRKHRTMRIPNDKDDALFDVSEDSSQDDELFNVSEASLLAASPRVTAVKTFVTVVIREGASSRSRSI